MRLTTREEFEIAIICVLPHEADAVKALFDRTYDNQSHAYGKLSGGVNVYVNGRIGQHNVVLCYMPSMGKGSAAGVASNLRMSYPGIQLALVVGICGAVPFPMDRVEIILGDVIISDSVVEYDFGRQYPDGFRRKHDAKTTLGRPNREIRAVLLSLKTNEIHNKFHEHTHHHIRTLQAQNPAWGTLVLNTTFSTRLFMIMDTDTVPSGNMLTAIQTTTSVIERYQPKTTTALGERKMSSVAADSTRTLSTQLSTLEPSHPPIL